LRIVAVIARMTTELEDLKRCENSPSLWTLHSDLLVVLLELSQTLAAAALRVMAQASDEGKLADAESVRRSLQKLRDRCDAITSILSQSESETVEA
jgi:hypothetical protein